MIIGTLYTIYYKCIYIYIYIYLYKLGKRGGLHHNIIT